MIGSSAITCPAFPKEIKLFTPYHVAKNHTSSTLKYAHIYSRTPSPKTTLKTSKIGLKSGWPWSGVHLTWKHEGQEKISEKVS